jgi:prepilin peptidase CpaA
MLALAAFLALSFPALVLTAAANDATSFTIPNWISLALVAIFPIAGLAAGVPLANLGLHAGIGAAALIAGMTMFALRWMGGGDAKLIAATTLWLGWPAALTFMLGAAIAGGALAVIVIALRSAPMRAVVLSGPRWMNRLTEPGEGIPYGVAIAAGALWAFPASPLAAALGL